MMTQIKAYALTSDADTFRLGVGAYRNGMDWAKVQRNEAIRQANNKAATGTPTPNDNLTLSFATEASDGTVEHASQRHSHVSDSPLQRVFFLLRF